MKCDRDTCDKGRRDCRCCGRAPCRGGKTDCCDIRAPLMIIALLGGVFGGCGDCRR